MLGTVEKTPEDAAVQNDAELDRQLNRLPPTIAQSLTEEQKKAVGKALSSSVSGHPVNIRFTMPFFGGIFLVATISGKERRGKERLADERKAHPLVSFGNVQFLLVFALILFIGIAIIGFTTFFMLA